MRHPCEIFNKIGTILADIVLREVAENDHTIQTQRNHKNKQRRMEDFLPSQADKPHFHRAIVVVILLATFLFKQSRSRDGWRLWCWHAEGEHVISEVKALTSNEQRAEEVSGSGGKKRGSISQKIGMCQYRASYQKLGMCHYRVLLAGLVAKGWAPQRMKAQLSILFVTDDMAK